VRLVLLAGHDVPEYVFGSNELVEVVGGAYLAASSTTDWIDEACHAAGGRWWPSRTGALIVTPDRETAVTVVRQVTIRALRLAPGLSLTGVSIEIAGATPTSAEIAEVRREWQRHSQNNPAGVRFQRVPVVADCDTTGLPAAEWSHTNGGPVRLSTEAIAKRAAAEEAVRRIETVLGGGVDLEWVKHTPAGVRRGGSPGDLIGVVHVAADLDHLPSAPGWSDRVVRAHAEATLRHAVAVAGDEPFPLLPLLCAGGEVTVLTEERLALDFVVAFLTAFGAPLAAESVLGHEVRRAGRERLTACAGVALMNRSHPLLAGYHRATELAGRAQQAVSASMQPDVHGLDVDILDRDDWRPAITWGGEARTDRPYLLPATEALVD
jgi:hypothetical protein